MVNFIKNTMFFSLVVSANMAISEEKSEAKDEGFTECISVKIKPHSMVYINSGKPVEEDRVLKIPKGWIPISGGGVGTPNIILCR